MAIPAWTSSQLDAFEICPRKFYHLKVARDVVDPPNEHAEWGTRVHTAFENAVKYNAPLGTGMEHWEGLAAKLRALPGEKLTEHKMALDRSFQPTSWTSAWTRGIADLVVINGPQAAVLDYKTGKRKPSDQLGLYAAYVFAHYPEVQQVSTAFVWLKPRKFDREVVSRDALPGLWQTFLPRVAKLERAYERQAWPARPSGLCKGWCPVKTCEFYQERS